MSLADGRRITEILRDREPEILADWIRQQLATAVPASHLIKESELREQSREFFEAFRSAVQSGDWNDIESLSWTETRDILARISRSRAARGFTPTETAIFIFSLKDPLLSGIRREMGDRASDEVWKLSALLDKLGLFTAEVYQKGREEVIARQQQEMLELSTPVIKLWEGILALPLIGTLDSERTQVVMQTLLQQIVETEASIAIIDITGVPTVDTLVAQYLLRTMAAARLMGADCIISGIRPQIAATIVHLGVDLSSVITKATLADALAVALRRAGMTVARIDSGHGTDSNP